MSSINCVRKLQILNFSKKIGVLKRLKNRRKISGSEAPSIHTTFLKLYFCDNDDSVQIWQSKLQYISHLKSLVQLLICNVFLTVM